MIILMDGICHNSNYGEAPMNLVSDRPTSAQPYIFKAEHHHKTDLKCTCIVNNDVSVGMLRDDTPL